MCGVAGILRGKNKDVEASVLKRMSDQMARRGPDSEGIHLIPTRGSLGSNLGFAFRRLAIIDLSDRANQPMTNTAGTLTIVFNGEIYNAPELKKSLKKSDRVFQSESDTEIILALYEEEGAEAFAKLNGMFGLALWDQSKQQLFLARDRMGIKPLYYSRSNGSLCFASEVSTLLQAPDVKAELSPQGVIEYFSFQYCLEEKSLFKNIEMVEPGTYMVFSPNDPSSILKKKAFWSMQYNTDYSRTIEDFAEELREKIIATIKRQTWSDVPVGTFLSSGMDTGSIAVLAKQLLPDLHSFTCGFDTSGIEGMESYFDERGDAKALAEKLQTHHHEIVLNHTDLPRFFSEKNFLLEDPRVGISYQIYEMARKVREYVTVVLSGTGGDELFGGYHWRYDPLMNIQSVDQHNKALYESWCRLIPDENRWNFFSEEIAQKSQKYSPWESFQSVMEPLKEKNSLHRSLYYESKGFLRGLLLVDDKLNMAASVEARVPLLDNEIVDLALAVPAEMKYDGETTKRVLKRALRGILPDEVLYRRKQGFTPPEAHWMRHQTRPFIEKTLNSTRFLERGWFKPKAVEGLLREHFSGEKSHRFLIWSLLCFDRINRSYIEGETQ